jgi:lipid II:glycine glycyltransferase (peptidoglycan interpeptide bridge formation enzyme)
LPPQPWSFFSNIHRHILSKEKGFVSLASHGGVPIAGAVFLLHKRWALFKFGASIERFLPLRGNNLQMWDAIKWLARHGFEQLDLGRTSKTNEGLRRFKLGWGTVERTLEYFKYDVRAGRYVREADTDQHRYGWLFRGLPQRVSRLAGALLYPHIS